MILPVVELHLVAANMNIGPREKRDHLGQNVLQKCYRFRSGRTKYSALASDRVGHVLAKGGIGTSRTVALILRIGRDRGPGMAGHFNLGDDCDMPLLGVGDDLPNIVLGIIAAILPI